MKNDHLYNLLSQLVTELRSYWRIKKYYLADAKNCKKCKQFYKNLLNTKEGVIKELEELFKLHNK